jgi:hypothetical protein
MIWEIMRLSAEGPLRKATKPSDVGFTLQTKNPV